MNGYEINDKNTLLFCEEYISTGDPKQAVHVIGVPIGNEDVWAEKYLANPKVKAMLAEKMGGIEKLYAAERIRVIDEFINLSKLNIGDYIKWENKKVTIKSSSDLSTEELGRVSEITQTRDKTGSVTVNIKFYDKDKNLERAAKVLGLYVNRHELSGPDEGPIQLAAIPVEQRLIAEKYAKEVADFKRKELNADSGEDTTQPSISD